MASKFFGDGIQLTFGINGDGIIDQINGIMNKGVKNAYRPEYNDEAWKLATHNGLNLIDLRKIDTASEFNTGEPSDRAYRYIVSRHEVKEWIKRRGIAGLSNLISRVNSGDDFYKLYYSK